MQKANLRASTDASPPVAMRSALPVAQAILACAFYAGTVVSFAAESHADEQLSLAAAPVSRPADPRPTYPLRASANQRFLVDGNNVPFLMVGDAPQTLIAKLSPAEAAMYMDNRRRYGINTLWINLLCNGAEGCNDDATTFDGIAPFTVAGDLSTPNPPYFQRAAEVINIAAANGMVILLDPIETSGWLSTLRANGTTKAFAYGQYLGGRYKAFPNIIWMHGNDFQSWRDKSDDELVQAVARGIRSQDPVHIHTVELNFLTSGSMDDPSWAPLIELDAAYTYFPTYAQVLAEYSRPNFKPVFLVEASYEFENLPNTDGGSTQNLRRQEYWAMLSGATGQVYGSAYTWRLEAGWQAKLDSPGAAQLSYLKDLFAPRRWHDLIPDQTHRLVTAGYDSLAGRIGNFAAYMGGFSGRIRRPFDYVKQYTGFGSVTSNEYATAAYTADGSLAMVYLPTVRTITVDLAKLAGPIIGRWYDPTNGSFVDAAGSPLANSGSRRFKPPGNNAGGDGDWVLVLEATAAH